LAASTRRARRPEATDEALDEADSGRERRRPAARASGSGSEGISERPPRESRGGRKREENADAKDERPMANVYLDVGKKDGVRVGELAKFLRERTELSRADIGRIRLRDHHSFVELPEEHVEAALAKLAGVELLGKPLGAERARGSKA
jgi:ATP-dependent RNA helicase DeaD